MPSATMPCTTVLLLLSGCHPVPRRVLQFLFTEINYGGRVTDDKDRRLINTLVSTFCAPQVLQEGYAFSPSGTYAVPDCETAAQVGWLGYGSIGPLADHSNAFASGAVPWHLERYSNHLCTAVICG
eukprot:GHRQ01032240.1.p3 GENE.GHRQ01032240.1~~GHRQ01032240.1.p3  ORF type:complete len:126 (-),score=28.20 GHRQ01032240.1:70-447(-)